MPLSGKQEALVFVNGKISSSREARVSVFDRGFLFGDAVYETSRSYDRCPLYLEEHWTRLRSSADKISIPIPWSDQELSRGLFDTARLFGKNDIYFRTIVTRGVIDTIGLDVATLSHESPTLVHVVDGLPKSIAKYQSEGVKIVTSKIRRNSPLAQDPNIKTSNYLNSLLALQDAKARGAQDAIMCDAQGNVTEGTTFSLFGVTKTGTLITPSRDVGILDSITRRHILKLAREDQEVKEGFFDLTTFQDCTEVFIASSVREIVSVREWDDKTYVVGGKATSHLHAKLKNDIRLYVENHPKF